MMKIMEKGLICSAEMGTLIKEVCKRGCGLSAAISSRGPEKILECLLLHSGLLSQTCFCRKNDVTCYVSVERLYYFSTK